MLAWMLSRKDPTLIHLSSMPFSFLVGYLSALRPQGAIRKRGATEGKLIQVPTAHIRGSNDELAKSTSVVLSELCTPHLRIVFVGL